MVALDTNVVLRVLVADDPDQCARAENAWTRASSNGGVFIPVTVVVELAWVLRVACKLDRLRIATLLHGLFDAADVTLENEAILRKALAAFERGAADLSDYVILESARTASALPVLTFDERFARHQEVVLVPALERG